MKTITHRRIQIAILAFVFLPMLTLTYQACGKFNPSEAMKAEMTSLGLDGTTLKTCGADYNPGHVMIHRLSNEEYNNTVRDLLHTTARPGDNFPSSSLGSSGFSNDSAALTVTNQLVSDYGAAAESLAAAVIASKGQSGGAYAKIAACAAAGQTSDDCAYSVIKKLATRALRRPVTETGGGNDMENLMGIFKGGSNFDEGLNDVIVALLLDPRFIFIYYDHPQPMNAQVGHILDGYELATRLSYFIWQSMPDETLLAAAADGSLSNTASLQAQVVRMLKDPKSKGLAKVLRREWAALSALDSLDVPGLDAETLAAVRLETQLFLEDLIENDRSLLTLVTSDDVFLNKPLATHYGWNIPAANSNSFVRVKAPSPERRGILTQASMMISHGGNGSYTHPVVRGRWVADNLFCQPPPPPKPGIPSIDGSVGDGTMRERLLAHTSKPDCIGCHRIMDVVGLGLENYDALGRWRTNYTGNSTAVIDASGKLPNGFQFNGPVDLMAGIAEQSKVRTCMVRKLMSLAVTREMKSSDDKCVAASIGQSQVTHISKLSDVITHIALSLQFRMNMGETAQ